MHPLLFALVLAVPQKQPGQAAKPKGHPNSWKIEANTGGDLTYDSNVWLLNKKQERRMESNFASDQVSGRFDDMEEVEDFILTPDVRLTAKGPGLGGARASAWFDLEFHYYFHNTKKGNLELGLGGDQSIGAAGRLELSFGFVPEYFKKNYLADAVDPTLNGVSSSERVYKEGVYQQWELALEYSHELRAQARKEDFGLDGSVKLGYRERSYDSPFHGRDQEAPFARLTLKADSGKIAKGGIYFHYEAVDSPTTQEVLLLDEPAFGVILNGDGDATDQNARTVQSVDRSHTETEIGLFTEFALAPVMDLEVNYAYLTRDFSSKETFDVGHRDRQDTRHEYGAALKFKAAKNVHGRFGFEYRTEDTNRPKDPSSTGETLDYRRRLIFLSISYLW